MNTVLMFFGALTIIGAVMMALVQHDLKRLLAFHAVSQVGYMIMGIGTGTADWPGRRLFHMLNHAIYKSCLFLGAGVVEKKAGTVDLDRLGGLATRLAVHLRRLPGGLAVHFRHPALQRICLQVDGLSGSDRIRPEQRKHAVGRMAGSSDPGFGAHAGQFRQSAAQRISVQTISAHPQAKASRQLPGPRPCPWCSWLACVCCSASSPMRFPLPYFILPALNEPVTFPGTWWATQASGLLLVAFPVGWIVYAFTMRNGKLRKCPTYIGGERMDETRIPGVPVGPERHVEVTGVDFYLTVEQLPVLKPMYEMARRKIFDVYETGGKARLG